MSRSVERATAWIYEGLWSVLTDLFCVPREAPTLPAKSGREPRRFRPAPGWLRQRKLEFWIVLLLVDLGLIAVWLAIWFEGNRYVALALAPLFVVAIVLPDILAYIAIHLRYDTTWYVLSDRSMRLRRGVLTIHETTITFDNIQNVTVRQGPLQRVFGVADVVVETAGGGGGHAGKGGPSLSAHTGIIEGVDDAPAIRDLILDRVRRARGAGLGDDRDEPASGGWSAPRVEALRAVRDEARALRAAVVP